jgi:hypothetical protein
MDGQDEGGDASIRARAGATGWGLVLCGKKWCGHEGGCALGAKVLSSWGGGWWQSLGFTAPSLPLGLLLIWGAQAPLCGVGGGVGVQWPRAAGLGFLWAAGFEGRAGAWGVGWGGGGKPKPTRTGGLSGDKSWINRQIRLFSSSRLTDGPICDRVLLHQETWTGFMVQAATEPRGNERGPRCRSHPEDLTGP